MKRTTVQLDVHDPRLPALTEALSNKTARQVIDELARSSGSIAELVTRMGVPFSTVDYTVKKLVKVGLVVPESKWWSVKGKHVTKYALADTQIVISPRPLLKGVLPAVLGSGLFALVLKLTTFSTSSSLIGSTQKQGVSSVASEFASSASSVAPDIASVASPPLVQPGATLIVPDVALWFLFGSLVGITLLVVWNVYLRRMKGGSVL